MSSSSSTTSKLEKEKLKLVQEKCQTLLNEMLRDEDNKYCVDCDAKGPRWASWNLGIFLCIRCAGIHRNLGVHISRVKSVNLDTWTPEQVVTMQQMGNSRARAVYEANMPDNFRRPQTDVALESFIRAKYEHKKYIAQEWVQPSIPKVNWDAEIEESLRKKKDAKKHVNSDGINLAGSAIPKPKPVSTNAASNSKPQNPPPISSAQAAAVSLTVNNASTESSEKPSNPSDDLLGLMGSDSTSNSTSLDPFASPVKTVSASGGGDMNDLGGLFATPDGSNDANAKKMTKESILSLYGQSNQFPGNNMFANNQTGAPAPTGNPFPQFNSQFNPNLVPGAQGGMNLFMNPGMVSTGSTPLAKDPGLNSVFNFQPDIGQLQQQIHGMNLSFGSPMQPPANPSAPLLGNFNQGSFGLPGLMGSTVTPNTGAAMPSQVSQSRNAGPFF